MLKGIPISPPCASRNMATRWCLSAFEKVKLKGSKLWKGKPEEEGVDTVTLYLGPDRQPEYYDYILSLKPKRIIFNPGTENPELVQLAKEQGIETVEGCTLVMLSIGAY
jgi:predicted CoA-binding protein